MSIINFKNYFKKFNIDDNDIFENFSFVINKLYIAISLITLSQNIFQNNKNNIISFSYVIKININIFIVIIK